MSLPIPHDRAAAPAGQSPDIPAAGQVLDAVKVSREDFTAGSQPLYTVIEPKLNAGDKRLEARRRTHLKCGIVLDLHDKFLIDCQIYDRSGHGARLRLAAARKLPRRIRLFDEIAKQMLDAVVAWQRGLSVGVRFPQADPVILTEARIAALGRKFYLGSV